jgi:hypothetical protein
MKNNMATHMNQRINCVSAVIMHINTAVAVFIITFALVGCSHLPFSASKPDITGILLQNGIPLSGVRISYCTKGQSAKRCEIYKQTTTDGHGQFFFENTWDLKSSVSSIGGSQLSYSIYFQQFGRDYHWNMGGLGHAPENVDLRCDIHNNILCTDEVLEP